MKKKTIAGWCLVWGVFSVFAWGTTAQAGQKFIIKPLISIEYRMDDNFYRTEDTERTVSTLTVSPGMEFGFRTEKSRVAAKGVLNFTSYEDIDSVPAGMTDADSNDFTGHHVTLDADTMLFTRMTAGIADTWINTRNPSERDQFDNFTDVNEYSINRIRPWVKYQITRRIAAGLEFRNTDIDFAADTEEDSSLSEWSGRLYYEVNKFTTIDLEYVGADMSYDGFSSDYTSSEYKINAVSQFKYFAFAGGIGYHERDFDQAGFSDLDTVSWHFSVKGQNPPDLAEGERPRSYMELAFAQNFNNTGNGNEYYRADRVTLMLGKLFLEKIDARINAYYQKSDYQSGLLDRDDDTWSFSGQASYFVNDWLTLTLRSGIELRDSSVAFNDYDNAYAAFRVTVNYDLGSR